MLKIELFSKYNINSAAIYNNIKLSIDVKINKIYQGFH